MVTEEGWFFVKLDTSIKRDRGKKGNMEHCRDENECASDLENILEWARLRVSQVRQHADSVAKYRDKLKARGETDRRLREFDHWRESTAFTDREKAAFKLSESMAMNPSEELAPGVLDETKHHFSSAEMVRLTLNIMSVNEWINTHVGIPARILVVEDDPADRELLHLRLKKERMADNVIFVRDGIRALSVLEDFQTGRREGKLIAVFLDLRLPGMDGLDLLRRIRAEREMEDLPVIVMTGSSDPKDIEECQRLKVVSYVEKPITFGSFSKAIANVFHQVKVG